MKLISANTSSDGKEISSTVELMSGETLNLKIRRTSVGICTISPNYEDMTDEVDDEEYEALDSLTHAFCDILRSAEWIEEES